MPVVPVSSGFFTLVSLTVLAPGSDDVPADLVIVTTPSVISVTVSVPSMEASGLEAAVAASESNSKPDGNVIVIMPVAGMAFCVVNTASASPVIPATTDAGVTLADESWPTMTQCVFPPESAEFVAVISAEAFESLTST